jgi:hypothetical protein
VYFFPAAVTRFSACALLFALVACAPGTSSGDSDAGPSSVIGEVPALDDSSLGAESFKPLLPPMGAGPLAPGLPPNLQAGSHAPPPEDRFAAALRAGEAGIGNQATAEAMAREHAAASKDDIFTELTWDELYELDLETGKPSPLLAALDGQPVKLPGFMVPLDDAASTVSEFLLVPYAGACIHVPPPPANQIVHVTMVDGYAADVMWWDPIWVRGALHIDDVAHAFGKASYRMEGLHTDVHTFEPVAP